MASSKELFPAPVGPVMAKRSKPEKSSSQRWRKLVKPSSSNLIGRILHLLLEQAESFHHFFRRVWVFCLAEVVGKVLMRLLVAAQFRNRIFFMRTLYFNI